MSHMISWNVYAVNLTTCTTIHFCICGSGSVPGTVCVECVAIVSTIYVHVAVVCVCVCVFVCVHIV